MSDNGVDGFSAEQRERILKMLESYEKKAVVWEFLGTILKWASAVMLPLVALKTFFGDILLKLFGGLR